MANKSAYKQEREAHEQERQAHVTTKIQLAEAKMELEKAMAVLKYQREQLNAMGAIIMLPEVQDIVEMHTGNRAAIRPHDMFEPLAQELLTKAMAAEAHAGEYGATNGGTMRGGDGRMEAQLRAFVDGLAPEQRQEVVLEGLRGMASAKAVLRAAPNLGYYGLKALREALKADMTARLCAAELAGALLRQEDER